ncbi:MAG: LysR family transcriptional regulator [Peptococcaceae bacterium]|nr:LysR family transcriptional regulator [Peptococcaceae bacterium]
MKIEYLKEFVVLAKYLNFSTAAEHLYISQPVLSRHIAALENELRVKLLHRNTQKVSLTEAGVLFNQRVQILLQKYNDLCEEVRLKEQGFDAELRIGLPYYCMDYYMGQVPIRFATEHPNIMLTYINGHPDQLVDLLIMDKLDVLLIAYASYHDTEGLVLHDLFDEQLIVLFPMNHPLAGRKSVTLSDLAQETFLAMESNIALSVWKYLQDLCLKNGFEPQGLIKFKHLESAIIALQNNQGIIVEGHNLYSLRQEGLSAVPLEGEGCFRRVSIVHKRDSTNPALPLLINKFKDIISSGR